MTDPDGRTVVQCETEGFSGRKQTISIDGGPVYRMSSKDMKKWEVEVQGDTFRWKKATESELKPLGVKKVRRGFQMLAPNGQLVALLGREKDKKVWHFAFFGLAAEGARDGDWMLAVATSGIMVLHVSIVKGVADAVGDAAGEAADGGAGGFDGGGGDGGGGGGDGGGGGGGGGGDGGGGGAVS